MLNTATVTKLQEMHLSAMAGAFQNQLKDPAFQGMSFEDRFGLIVDQEWSTRKSNHAQAYRHRWIKEPSAHWALPRPEVFRIMFSKKSDVN